MAISKLSDKVRLLGASIKNLNPTAIYNKINELVDTVNNSAPTYKVYTALLTQSGGDSPNAITNTDLTIGVTYLIKDNGGNFTNVGAPNNNAGTFFIATGTTPNDWGGVTLEYNEGAPVVTVLENTIGDIWFTYDNVGIYGIYSNELFSLNKTFTLLTPGGGNVCIPLIQPNSSSIVVINVNDAVPPNNPLNIDGLHQIEIRVYD